MIVNFGGGIYGCSAAAVDTSFSRTIMHEEE